MWIDYFENNNFAKIIFNNLSQLDRVKIDSINFTPYNDNVLIKIELTTFVDSPPSKWGKKGMYSLIVELDFYNISLYYLNKISMTDTKIVILKKSNGFNFISKDGIEMCFDFECGVIQSIKPNLLEK